MIQDILREIIDLFENDLSHEFSCLKKIDINYKKINHEFFYKFHPLDYKGINLKKKSLIIKISKI